MFKPTHTLVSRSRRTPVKLVGGRDRIYIVTQTDWQARRKPSFELDPKLGIFCQGIPVVGYHLEPLEAEAGKKAKTEPPRTAAQAELQRN